ncbi:MAG: hypothetical protein JXX29_03755 [Deltaproteobacteria bacterium]|nr:hypothetical protein [Deltaproteobacteria bacterium]MBN2670758.1 hypothetical protein [Deltaproteobacteria bacterium]
MRLPSCIFSFAIPLLIASVSFGNTADVQEQTSDNQLTAAPETDAPGSEMTERGVDIRGVYMPVGKVKTWSVKKMLQELQDTRANAVIIDVKDDMGRVTFTQSLEMAQGGPHGYQHKMKKLVTTLQENNIYVIGRLVCFKDHWFATEYGSEAMRDARDGKKWKDRHGLRWVDPHSQVMRDYIVSIAAATEAFGFDEVQLDYVRFPVEPDARFARYPRKKGDIQRYEAIAELLKQVDAAITVPLSIDVFGLTAYHPEESEALGQYLEYLAPHIDAISPMVYLANWPEKYWADPKPERTHAVILGACKKIRERLGDNIIVRPLLQGFSWRAENWGYGFIVNQIEAAELGGSQGYLFWNAAGRYGKVKSVWTDMDEEQQEENEAVVSRR